MKIKKQKKISRNIEFLRAKAEVLRPIIEYYRQDKLKLIRFLIKEGYKKKKIAEVLDVDPSAITRILQRNK